MTERRREDLCDQDPPLSRERRRKRTFTSNIGFKSKGGEKERKDLTKDSRRPLRGRSIRKNSLVEKGGGAGTFPTRPSRGGGKEKVACRTPLSAPYTTGHHRTSRRKGKAFSKSGGEEKKTYSSGKESGGRGKDARGRHD